MSCCDKPVNIALPTVYTEALSYGEALDELICKHNTLVQLVNAINIAKTRASTLVIDVTNPPNGYTAMVGDGITDNTEAFKALASNEKITLFFPDGIYATKPVTSKADILGSSINSAQILCLNDDTDTSGLILTGNASIRSIKINGNKDAQGDLKAALELASETQAIGVKCYDSYTGIKVSASNCGIIADCSDCEIGLNLSGTGNFCVVLADPNSIVDEGEKNTTFTNHAIHQHTDYYHVLADEIHLQSSGSNEVKGKSTYIISDQDNIEVRSKYDLVLNSEHTINEEAQTVNIVSNNDNVEIKGKYDTVINAEHEINQTASNINSTASWGYNINSDHTTITGNTIKAKSTDGTKETDLLNIPNGYVSVKNYGAKGDGSTDDYQAILSALQNNNGFIFFPPGTYCCSKSIWYNTHLTACGSGSDTTIIKCTATETIDAVIGLGDGDGKISGITIDANDKAINGIYLLNCSGTNIDDVKVKNATYTGLNIYGTSTLSGEVIHISNSYFYLNGNYGILITNHADVEICNTECVSNSKSGQNTGYNFSTNSAAKVMNCHFWNFNDSFGYYRTAYSVYLNSTNCNFTNCHIEGGYTGNIYIDNNAQKNVFTNCVIYASFGSHSVYLNNWGGAFFNDCSFNGQASDETSYKAAWLGEIMCNSIRYLIVNNCLFSSYAPFYGDFYFSIISGIFDGDSSQLINTSGHNNLFNCFSKQDLKWTLIDPVQRLVQ